MTKHTNKSNKSNDSKIAKSRFKRRIRYKSYFKTTELTVEQQIEQTLSNSLATSLRHFAYNAFVNNMLTVEWHCYDCRSPIHVDISELIAGNSIPVSEYLCEKHTHETSVAKHLASFVKYEQTFIKHVLQLIKTKTFDT